ncbi:MAG: hypothetical protein AAF126_23340, partial [Chloroflexota bacterium]
ITLMDKAGETFERNLRMFVGDAPEIIEENGVRYVETDNFTRYVDLNDTSFVTITLARTGDEEIDPQYIEDWRTMSINIRVE